MNHRVDAPEQAIDFNNENSNTSANPTFDAVLGAWLVTPWITKLIVALAVCVLAYFMFTGR